MKKVKIILCFLSMIVTNHGMENDAVHLSLPVIQIRYTENVLGDSIDERENRCKKISIVPNICITNIQKFESFMQQDDAPTMEYGAETLNPKTFEALEIYKIFSEDHSAWFNACFDPDKASLEDKKNAQIAKKCSKAIFKHVSTDDNYKEMLQSSPSVFVLNKEGVKGILPLSMLEYAVECTLFNDTARLRDADPDISEQEMQKIFTEAFQDTEAATKGRDDTREALHDLKQEKPQVYNTLCYMANTEYKLINCTLKEFVEKEKGQNPFQGHKIFVITPHHVPMVQKHIRNILESAAFVNKENIETFTVPVIQGTNEKNLMPTSDSEILKTFDVLKIYENNTMIQN